MTAQEVGARPPGRGSQCSAPACVRGSHREAGEWNHIVFTHAGERLLGAGVRLGLQVAIPLASSHGQQSGRHLAGSFCLGKLSPRLWTSYH